MKHSTVEKLKRFANARWPGQLLFLVVMLVYMDCRFDRLDAKLDRIILKMDAAIERHEQMFGPLEPPAAPPP